MIGFKFKHLIELGKNSINILYKEHILIKWTLINNNTSLGYSHSKDVVLHVRPDLLKNMLQCLLGRWYDKVLPNSALTFPKLDSLPFPQLCVIPGHQKLKALILRWYRILALVSVNSTPAEPSRPLFFLLLGLNFWLVAHHYLLDWTNWFLSSGSQFPKEWQPQLHKLVRKGSLQ